MVCLSPVEYELNTISHRQQTYHINLVDQTHIQRTRPRRKTVFFKTSLRVPKNTRLPITTPKNMTIIPIV